MPLASFLKKLRRFSTVLALSTAALSAFQGIELPNHEIEHSLAHLQIQTDQSPQLIEGQCDLCLAYHLTSATLAFTHHFEPKPAFVRADVLTPEAPVIPTVHTLADARAPPVA